MSDPVAPWTLAHQAPLSMEFSRQEYRSGVPFPSPGDPPDTGIKPWSPALQEDSLPDWAIKVSCLSCTSCATLLSTLGSLICLVIRLASENSCSAQTAPPGVANRPLAHLQWWLPEGSPRVAAPLGGSAEFAPRVSISGPVQHPHSLRAPLPGHIALQTVLSQSVFGSRKPTR